MRKSVPGSIILFIAVSLFTIGTASAADLHDFTSDGCSLFPDGNFKDRALWCDCCLAHDISYWRGGTKEDRKHADETLRDCVLERTGSKALADLIYDGVRAGGHPVFPTWYRWGYGWKYGKSYAPLTEQENQQVERKLKAYYVKHPTGYCRERHGGVK
jgi:hypothetical protein